MKDDATKCIIIMVAVMQRDGHLCQLITVANKFEFYTFIKQ